MCGIFGVITQSPLRDAELRKVVAYLGIASEVRGRDAAGFAAWVNGSVITDKSQGKFSDILRHSGEWRRAVYTDSYSLIGHTRASTSGTPKDNWNNHPFHSKRYSLVHNGIVSAHKCFAKEQGIELKTDCDSEILLHLVNREPAIDKGVASLFSVLDDWASYGVAILDRESGNVYLARSKSVPVYISYVERWNAVIFASTKEIIAKALLNAVFVDERSNVMESILDGFEQIPAGSLVTIQPNLAISTVEVADGEKNDLYADWKAQREVRYQIYKEGVTTTTMDKLLRIQRPPMKDVELSHQEKKQLKKFRKMPRDRRMKLWRNMQMEHALQMSEVEYTAYMEFCNV